MADNFPWNDENLATLTRMFHEGKPASVIALAIGAPTRGVVCGKLHRLGFKRSPGERSQASRLGGVVCQEKRRQARAASLPVERLMTPGRVPRRHLPLGQRPAPTVVCEAVIDAEPLWVAFHDIKECQCRWPRGDATQGLDNFSFCGLPKVEGSYCAGHARTAINTNYRPAPRTSFAPRYARA